MIEGIHWYCLRTKPKTERITSQLLRSELNLEVFSPFLRFERARKNGRMWVTEAMFPGYIFAQFDYVALHRRIRAIRGVMTVVSFGQEPAIISPQIIRELRNLVQDQETIQIQPTVQVGEEVNVISGPFQGLRAIVTRVIPAKERIALLLEVLGMEREIEISTAMVLPDLPHPMARQE